MRQPASIDVAEFNNAWQHQRVPEPFAHPSKLYEYLLTEFSWGRMSPQQVQAISALAISDMERASTGEIFYDLYFLSNIGTQGRHLNNCYRDLMNRIEKTDGLLPVTVMEIPTKRGDCMAEVLLPHEVFAHMYHHDHEQFVKQFLPLGQDDLVKFWSQCRETPSFKDTPGYKSLKPKYCIPIGLHGDEVPVAGRGKCYCTYSVVFSWFSLVSGHETNLGILAFALVLQSSSVCRGRRRNTSMFLECCGLEP